MSKYSLMIFLLLTNFGAAGFLCFSAAAQTVPTYHNDSSRTGWNSAEKSLTPATVSSGRFNLLHSVPLDGQVDSQPLFVAKQVIAGQTHHVVYVATSHDTIYAIDGSTGAILISQNFGAPVPQSALPGQCYNNGPSIGIDSTPVISTGSNTLYAITYTFEGGAPVFRLHSLALDTLRDKVPPVVVTASHPLSNGSTITLDPTSSRQRSALLLSGSSVYAAFASYCDYNANRSRGWLLGWDAQTLTPLPHNELTDQLATSPDSFFLSSIWMSGFGPATAKPNSPLYFTTGNSDYSGSTYNKVTNLSESLLQMAPDLSRVQNHFTPTDEANLDQTDWDLGSGGAMLPPTQVGLNPSLVVAAGKAGELYLLDRSHLNAPPLGGYSIGNCWCGPSYFTGSDGVGRVVTSGGSNVMTWRLETSTSAPPALALEYSTSITSGQDGGFFTSISSNGVLERTAVIWAVGRPTDSDPADVSLFAIDPTTGNIIYSAVAGTWPNTGGNANIVPTVANGRVYVASDQELAIFGLGTPPTTQAVAAMRAMRAATVQASASSLVLAAGEHAIFGRIIGVNQFVLTLKQRTGARLLVDVSKAKRNSDLAVPVIGRAVLAVGTFAPNGVMAASYLQRAKKASALWPADR